MDHQDWKPVVFKKNPTKKSGTTSSKVAVASTNSNKGFNGTGKKIADDDGDIKKVPTVGIGIGKQIAQARTAKKLSQKQLATQMNLPLQTVQLNENGKAIRNNGLLAKFERALGTKFER